MHYNCLIVDDEEPLGAATAEYFNIFEVSTKYVCSYEACLSAMATDSFDLILLDINLKDKNGFELCKTLRQTTTIPILFISARQSDDDVLLALNIGGDDYIKKPCPLSVLLAKVKAVLKRYESSISQNAALEFGKLKLDVKAMKAYIMGEDIHLKTMEFKLLHYLVTHANTVIPKAELFEKVWGDHFFSDGTLNVHIRRLREKIEEDPNNPKFIKTIWGTGYTFEI